jgi:hypothetical protein
MALYFETLHPLRLIASMEEIAILVDIGLIMTPHIHACKKSCFGAQNVKGDIHGWGTTFGCLTV